MFSVGIERNQWHDMVSKYFMKIWKTNLMSKADLKRFFLKSLLEEFSKIHRKTYSRNICLVTLQL